METSNTNSSVSSSPRAATPPAQPYLMVIGGARVGELHRLEGARTIVGRSPEAQIRLGDTGISREHAELVCEGGRVRVRDLGSTNGTYLNGERADARELRDGDKLTVGAATLLVFTHSDGIERDYQRGRFRASVQDAATAALRREVFLERLVGEVSFARRHAAPLAVLAWELDGFAALEMRLGAAATQECVFTAARAVGVALGAEDLRGVLGPGKFVVACRETGLRAAAARAERIRAAVAQTIFEDGVPRAVLSASVGVSASGSGVDKTSAAADALLRRADAALGVARAHGGDGVEIDAAVVEAD